MMNQRWRDLTFLHWAVDPGEVAHRMPPGVRPDTLDGATYVGLIPFRMVGAGVGRSPGVPWFGTFLETNVRLYSVDDTGRRGIVFLSLDADRAVVVAGARAVFGLPYRWARMRHRVSGDVHTYDARLRRPGKSMSSHVVIRAGAPRESTALDHFLSSPVGAARPRTGRTLYVPNRHEVWPVQRTQRCSPPRRRSDGGGVGCRTWLPVHRSRGVQSRSADRFGFPRTRVAEGLRTWSATSSRHLCSGSGYAVEPGCPVQVPPTQDGLLRSGGNSRHGRTPHRRRRRAESCVVRRGCTPSPPWGARGGQEAVGAPAGCRSAGSNRSRRQRSWARSAPTRSRYLQELVCRAHGAVPAQPSWSSGAGRCHRTR